ncbi:MAG: VanZ family protein [Planctomycetaceae bacterium]|nr:VanZ family protein [Planctomycetaceae bacterium]
MKRLIATLQSPGFHLLYCLGLFLTVTWALLSPDPFGTVRNTPLILFRSLNDLILHAGVFSVLSATCISFGLRLHQRVTWPFVLFLLMYAVSTEWLQSVVPGRTCDPADGLANVAGILSGLMAVRFLAGIRLTTAPISVHS